MLTYPDAESSPLVCGVVLAVGLVLLQLVDSVLHVVEELLHVEVYAALKLL